MPLVNPTAFAIPGAVTGGATAASGSAATSARSDHVHSTANIALLNASNIIDSGATAQTFELRNSGAGSASPTLLLRNISGGNSAPSLQMAGYNNASPQPFVLSFADDGAFSGHVRLSTKQTGISGSAANVERFTISNTGLVGINQPSPDEQLTVAGNIKGTSVKATGLTGATSGARLAGGIASDRPSSGTFAVGDVVVDQTGRALVCTSATGSGTWYGPPEVQIATQTLSTVTATISFTGIPNTFRHLRLLISGTVTAAVAGAGIALRLNNDAGTNYWNNDNGTGQTSAYVGILHGATNFSTTANLTDCTVLNYSLAVNKGIISRGGWNNSTTGYVLALSSQPWQEWRNTAVCNRVDLSVVGGSFNSGTVVSLIGIYT